MLRRRSKEEMSSRSGQVWKGPSSYITLTLISLQPQLHQQLTSAALAVGVKIKTGIKVTSVDVENTAILLESGERIDADVVIAADGARVSFLAAVASPLLLTMVFSSSLQFGIKFSSEMISFQAQRLATAPCASCYQSPRRKKTAYHRLLLAMSSVC